MNKFAIKKIHNNNKQSPQHQQECSVDFLNNRDEFANQTLEEKRLYDQIVSRVSDSGTIKLDDSLPEIEYLLYLLYDVHDEFLDIFFTDPTQDYLNYGINTPPRRSPRRRKIRVLQSPWMKFS